ncbi:MucB/RseB C-terminal domain-containing protein [Marinobacteraceae bacterium S3BR75-40.1]
MLAWLLAMPAHAENPKTAQDWLKQLEPALDQTSYRGVFIYSRGGAVSAMRIVHDYENGRVYERLIRQDGAGSEIVRKGNDVVCLLPDSGGLKLHAQLPTTPFSQTFRNRERPLSRWYQSRLLPEDRVAGHTTVVVALQAKDAYRYSHRLWLEANTGLLVKSQVRSANDDILEHFQFTQLEITDDIKADELDLPKNKQARSAIELDTKPLTSQRPTPDWSLSWLPEGFEVAAPSQDKRGYAVYSDGLASFSVFVDREEGTAMPEGVSRLGATTVFLRRFEHDGKPYRLAVIGEIPPKTAMQVAQHVQLDGVQIGARSP